LIQRKVSSQYHPTSLLRDRQLPQWPSCSSSVSSASQSYFGLVRRLCSDLTESSIDLLLSIIRIAGVRLRTEFATDFRAMIIEISNKANDFQKRRPNDSSQGRLGFLLTDISNLRDNKVNASGTGRFSALRTWLRGLPSAGKMDKFVVDGDWEQLQSGTVELDTNGPMTITPETTEKPTTSVCDCTPNE